MRCTCHLASEHVWLGRFVNFENGQCTVEAEPGSTTCKWCKIREQPVPSTKDCVLPLPEKARAKAVCGTGRLTRRSSE